MLPRLHTINWVDLEIIYFESVDRDLFAEIDIVPPLLIQNGIAATGSHSDRYRADQTHRRVENS